jgi:Ser/Thr protein kinase RdoA (MazF antagonist)
MNQVRQVLERYPPDCQPSQIEPLGSAGGMSGAQFWRLATPCGRLGLRRWPVEHPTGDGLRFIHSVLRYASDNGLKIVPVPLAAVDGETFIEHGGHLWELAPWLPGAADYEKSPRVEKLRAAMTALAQFHAATTDFNAIRPLASSRAPSLAIVARLTRLHELQTDGIDTLARSINDAIWPELVPFARQFLAALPRVLPHAIAQLSPLANVPLPLQPAIRDIWHDHVLFEGDDVTGLVDFGATQIETPTGDVARLLGSLVDDDAKGWREGLAAYSAARPLTEQETAAVSALDISGTILAGCNWIRWIHVDGKQFENGAQVLTRFTRLLDRVLRIEAQSI